jgi:hypothetical protein
MIGNKFQLDIATGRLTLPVVILLSFFLWIISAQSWAELGSLAIVAATGYLMIEMNTAFSLIRTRTAFPVCIYWYSIASLFFLHPFDWTQFVPLLFILATYLLFNSYESSSAPTCIYHSFLFIGIASLAFPQIIYFAPIFLISTISFRSLSAKGLLASLLGLATPYWFLLGHAFYHDEMHLFYAPFQELCHFYPISYQAIPHHVLFSWGFITCLLLVTSLHYLLVSYQDKTRTRIYLSFMVAISIWTAIFIALQPQHITTLLPVQLIGTSFLAAHLFTLTRNRFSNIFFVVIILIYITLTSYNLWMLFFNS